MENKILWPFYFCKSLTTIMNILWVVKELIIFSIEDVVLLS